MPQARRFEELQVDHEGRDLPDLPRIEVAPRQITRLEVEEGEPAPPRLKAARS
jgi:DNA recombination protein RmuC